MNFRKRIDAVRRQFVKKRLDAVLVSSVQNITYLTGFSNFSKDEREAFVLITADQSYIFTDGRYSEAVQEQVLDCTLVEISSTSPFRKSLEDLVKKFSLKRIGFEQDNLTVSEYQRISSLASFHPFDTGTVRVIKEKEEIACIEKACKLGDKAFNHLLGKLKVGLSEKEVAFELEYFIKRNGSDISFPPIIAFGSNSSVPHHQTGDRMLKQGDIVLLDFGVKVDNYCSDMTRTVFFGKANGKYRKMYEAVLTAQKKAIEYLYKVGPLRRTDLHAKEVDKVARDYIVSCDYPTIPHSLGHGIGLEVHEAPRLSPTSKDILQSNMVFSVEPGIYLPARSAGGPAGRQGIPGFGGVRIEDLFVIEKNGLRQLTQSSKYLIEIV